MSASLNQFFFAVYPYICLAVFFMGSLARFDRDQYTWKSDSSQMLRTGTLRWGSNLFHVGILFLFFGHFAGLLDFGETALALTTDGVGTKMLVADQMEDWSTVGIDCIAMNVNDVICVGASGNAGPGCA